jgi:DNA-directed RNA polymerase specialized sigma24 family protein
MEQLQATNYNAIITAETEFVKLSEDKKVLNEILERLDSFIVTEVEKRAYGLSLEKLNEMKQNVRIKLWRALQARSIQYPFAYVRTIIINEFNDLGRGRKPLEQIVLDDYGEVNQGQVLVNLSEGWGDPEHALEQREAVESYLDVTVEAISTLPRRQQLAMVCLLLERIDDIIQLKEVFERYQIPIEVEDWPNDKVDKQRLKALISVARRKIAQFIENSEQISGRDVSNTSLPAISNTELRHISQR